MITLATELSRIRGISPKFITRLDRMGIKTVKDLLFHFPHRYEDFSAVVPIAELQPNQAATVAGVIKNVSLRRTWRRNMVLIEAVIADASGAIKAIWFNQPFLSRTLRPGLRANFAGKVTVNEDEIYLSNPAYEFINRGASAEANEFSHTGRLVPIYPETRGLTSRGIRYLVRPLLAAVGNLPDFIPPQILRENAFPEINQALRFIHFPEAMTEVEDAKTRFAFADLFLLQLTNIRTRNALAKKTAPQLIIAPDVLERAIARLPFELTPSQKQSANEIAADLGKGRPMNRLLQGDVGSGKTVVAALAALIVARNGKQAAFMAPTEVLARQHYKTLTRIIGTVTEHDAIGIGLHLGAESRVSHGNGLEAKKPKRDFLAAVAEGKLSIVIGTHALIQKNVAFGDLALVVVDEQHRFGVQQRAALVARGSSQIHAASHRHESAYLPHFLSMSATPIPRTLSLTLFGDLDLSTITELPQGRKPIITKVVDPANRTKAYAFLREQIKGKRQAFVICPRIEPVSEEQSGEEHGESPNPSGAQQLFNKKQLLWREVKTVKEEYEKLSRQIFPEYRVAMLHGKMKSAEKEQVMATFAAGATDILVSTSVIEVGVDVPNANVMVIEGAEHFGLAQLYQFRGRIGRGEHQSFCLLFTHTADGGHERLNALLSAKNGFELAEEDLKIRGPGQFLGERQTGLPDLAMRSLNNLELIRAARAGAEETLKKDPELKSHPVLAGRLNEFTKQIHLE